MRYDELDGEDLDTLERHAWVEGDIRTAELAGCLLDAREELERVRDQYDETQEAWGDYNAEMRTQLEELHQALEVVAKVSGREVLIERVEECLNLIDKVGG